MDMLSALSKVKAVFALGDRRHNTVSIMEHLFYIQKPLVLRYLSKLLLTSAIFSKQVVVFHNSTHLEEEYARGSNVLSGGRNSSFFDFKEIVYFS